MQPGKPSAAPSLITALGLALAMSTTVAAPGDTSVVYRCPGALALYSDAITADQAQARGCQVAFKAGGRGSAGVVTAARTPHASAMLSSVERRPTLRDETRYVDAATQRARDIDAMAVLDYELQREQARLSGMHAELARLAVQPAGPKAAAAQQDGRLSDLRQSVARSEADIAAIKREIARHSATQRSIMRIATER